MVMAAGRVRAEALRDVRRVINLGDVLYLAGKFLTKRSLRIAVLAAGIGLVGYVANFVPGLSGFTPKQAVTLPLVVGSAMLVGGLGLTYLSTIFASRLVSVAQANDLNLMEDYRKAQAAQHLQALWDRVFRYEPGLGSSWGADMDLRTSERLRRLHAEAASRGPAAVAREAFMTLATYALMHPLPQTRQWHQTGIDLRFFEDWRDGAYFDRTDVKLAEQYEASATLQAVRDEVAFSPAERARNIGRTIAQKFWFAMITRAIAVQVGGAVHALNRRHDTCLFNSQALLWPDEDRQPWLDEFPGAREDLGRRKRAIMNKVFGSAAGQAQRMIDRMVLPDLIRARQLRAKYDPEYWDGTLDYDLLGDWTRVAPNPRRLRRARRRIEQWRRDLADFLDVLRALRPKLFDADHVEALRAVKIAFHTNRGRMKSRFRRLVKMGADEETIAEAVGPVIDAAVAARQNYSRRLVCLRVHHELARLARRGYFELVEALAGAG